MLSQRYNRGLFILLVILIYFHKCLSSETAETESHGNSTEEGGIAVAKWNFHEFELHVTIMSFLVIVILLKMVYHRLTWLAAYVPESLILIIIGIAFGAIIIYGNVQPESFRLTPELFFTFLLPPIVLDAAYALYNRIFGDFLFAILIFAVLGTILNFLIIGPIMYGLDLGGAMGLPKLGLNIKEHLLFSSLIVAVDPVAVLAIFQDIGVAKRLYFLVFGESLLNDAVTVVLYNVMESFSSISEVTGNMIGVGIASVFTISLGGFAIGVVFGIVTCLITRFKGSLEVITVILLGYFSYIFADMVGWSGIISMVGCGLVQAAYAFNNLEPSNVAVVRTVVHLSAELSEAVIFLFIGVAVFSYQLVWHTGYHLWAIVCCLFSRLVVVIILSAVINLLHLNKLQIKWKEQFLIFYGGLRGAVALSLALLIPERALSIGEQTAVYNQNLQFTATLIIIFFTVGVMGLTMKPLVKLLRIKMEGQQVLSLFEEMNNVVVDNIMSGVEVITGQEGRNFVREFIIKVDEKYVRPILQRKPVTRDQKLVKVYKKIAVQLLYASLSPGQSSKLLDQIPETLRQQPSFSNISVAEKYQENAENGVKPEWLRLREMVMRAEAEQVGEPTDRAAYSTNLLELLKAKQHETTAQKPADTSKDNAEEPQLKNRRANNYRRPTYIGAEDLDDSSQTASRNDFYRPEFAIGDETNAKSSDDTISKRNISDDGEYDEDGGAYNELNLTVPPAGASIANMSRSQTGDSTEHL